MSKIKFINYVNIEKNFSKLSFNFMFNPDYFINTNHYEIKKEEEDNEINTIKDKLKKLKSEIENIIGNNYTFKSVRKLHLDSRIMPDDNETFEKLFLEKEYKPEYQTHIYKSIKNINLLKSLLAGKISYLRGDLPTKTVITTLNIPMGKLQEPQYVIARSTEIKMARRKRQNDDENLSNLRSKSRQICNSFIPYIHKNKIEDKKDEDIENEDIENENMDDDIEEDELQKKDKVRDLKDTNVLAFIKNNIIKIEEEEENKVDSILENIKDYSCKCAYLIEAIRKTGNRDWINETDNNYFPQGKVLIYSDFRELYSGGVSFIAELLSIADFGYINFINILDNLIETLNSEENTIYQEANWGTEETTIENKNFQEKVINFFEEYQNKQYHNKTYYLWHTSSAQNMKINYLAKFVYNHIENLNGKLLRIMFITKSGSEGISFKAVRQVHIMEPFWQQTRETQVIGRAVRYKSHDDLPDQEKNVFVYKYLASFTNTDILDKDLSGDKNLTTDEYITEVSNKKQSIINSFYELVKEVALDCPYNNETLTCFSYNNIEYYENPEKNPFIFNDGISTYNVDIKRKEAYLVKKNNQVFIVYNNNLYDYEKYNLHKVLIKIGEIEQIGTKINFKITRDYSAHKTCFIQTNIKTEIEKTDFEDIEYNINNLDISTFSIIKFPITGGSIESDSDSEYSSEEYIDSEDDDIIDNIDDIDDDNNDEQDKNEIIIDDENYKNGDYICLEDKLTDDKILIGEITKITNKYIEISDTRIPIVTNKMDRNQLILLYKKISKNDLINQLGMEMLNIYKNSDNIYMIYEKYIKNPYSNKLINNIYLRLQEYKKTPIITQIPTDTTEYDMEIHELSQEISHILDNLSDKSLHLSELDLSPELGSESDQSVKKMPVREPATETFNHLKEIYIKLLNLYISSYLKKVKKNPTFKKINTNKNIIKKLINENNNDEDKNIISKYILYLFYNECSLVKTNDNLNELSIENEEFYEDLIKDLRKDKSKKTFMKIKKNGIEKYILYIDIIKESLEKNIKNIENNSDEEEESEKIDSEQYSNIKQKINKYNELINPDNKELIELEIIENIWYLTEYIRIRNYDIQEVEKKLINSINEENEFNINKLFE